ncbi:MAG TPA: type II toxin-antitoxin system RelE/ParE family toxin [Pirellulales bacterium]|jgi:plasmid stabilization system protein ParE
MNLPIRLLPEAKAEFDAAADWYEQRRTGLGLEFMGRIHEAFQRIADHPEIKATVYQDLRQSAVQQFPYVVVYRQDGNQILVVAVFHTARDQTVWESRV